MEHPVFVVYSYTAVIVFLSGLLFSVTSLKRMKYVIKELLRDSIRSKWYHPIKKRHDEIAEIEDDIILDMQTQSAMDLDDEKSTKILTGLIEKVMDTNQKGAQLLEKSREHLTEHVEREVNAINFKIKSFAFYYAAFGVSLVLYGGFEHSHNIDSHGLFFLILSVASIFYGTLIYKRLQHYFVYERIDFDDGIEEKEKAGTTDKTCEERDEDGFNHYRAFSIVVKLVILTWLTALAIYLFLIIYYPPGGDVDLGTLVPDVIASISLLLTIASPLILYYLKMRRASVRTVPDPMVDNSILSDIDAEIGDLLEDAKRIQNLIVILVAEMTNDETLKL